MFNIQSMNVLIPSTCFDFTGRTSFQPETDLLAKAKITHTLSHQGYLTQMMSVLTHKEQESLHELYLHSLEESISLK